MKIRPDLLPSLLRLLNFALIGFFFLFFYLLFGDTLIQAYRDRPVAMEVSAFRASRINSAAAEEEDMDEIVDGIHVQTGLIYAEGFNIVRGTCTACHSAKLVTQNRATREGWEEMIRWMQTKQGLGDLGTSEAIILDYLAANYAPEEIGRRANIDVESIEWYVLDLEKE